MKNKIEEMNDGKRASLRPHKLCERDLLAEKERLDTLLQNGGMTLRDVRRLQEVQELLAQINAVRGGA